MGSRTLEYILALIVVALIALAMMGGGGGRTVEDPGGTNDQWPADLESSSDVPDSR